MKIFFTIVAWFGLAIMALGVILSTLTSVSMMIHPPTPYGGGVDFGHAFAFIGIEIGFVLMFIGGMVANPKYFSISTIVIGSLYIISFLPFLNLFKREGHIQWRILIPGMLTILLGLFLLIRDKLFTKIKAFYHTLLYRS
jgi:hypothetical protein